jgi:phage terminase small subunit
LKGGAVGPKSYIGGRYDRLGTRTLDAASFGILCTVLTMGLRGPKKKLPHIERLEGNPGRRSLTDSGINATGDVFIPDHLSPDARGCMSVVIGSMPPGTYSTCDSYLLAGFAEAWALHVRAAHEIVRPDFQYLVGTARGGKRPNPWLRIAAQQAQLMATLGDRLGLNPKARLDLRLPEDRPVSRFEGLLGQNVTKRRFHA